MALLDFIKNRNAAPQQDASQERKQEMPSPQTAKQMYAAQAAQDKAAEKPITPEIKAQADRILATVREPQQQTPLAAAPIAAGDGSNHAQLQKQTNQDNVQAALSPTDAAAGKTALQADKTVAEPKPRAPQTVPRRPPSWER